MLPEPIAIAFANTRSSADKDRITTLVQWRAWVDPWPGLRRAGHAVDDDGLALLQSTRNDVQMLLRSATGKGHREPEATGRLLELARSMSSLDLRWRDGRPTLALAPDAAPATVIAQHLTHAALDLLLTGPPFVACEGLECRKLFVASRPDRRWCDSAVCGNRARVRTYSNRARQARTSG